MEDVLNQALAKLQGRYPMLHFHLGGTCTTSNASKPFLHAWKPVDPSAKTQGLAFFPTFHCIMEQDVDLLVITLYTYHGKCLLTMKVELDALDDQKLDILDSLATDSLHVCQGIQG